MLQPPTFPDGETARLVVFRLDEQRYALPLRAVERIVRAVAITPLPNAPDIVLGVIDVEGEVLPVFDIRRRFGLPQRPLSSEDHLSIANASGRRVALLIDAAEGVVERASAAILGAATLAPGIEHIHGVVQLDDGLVLIHDLERFLSPDEASAVERALIDAPRAN